MGNPGVGGQTRPFGIVPFAVEYADEAAELDCLSRPVGSWEFGLLCISSICLIVCWRMERV
jgi:hypothetical protein